MLKIMKSTKILSAFLLILCVNLSTEARTTVTTNTAGDIVLANDNASLIFSGGKEFLFKEFNMAGKNLLPSAGSTTYPWELTYRGPIGENPKLQPFRGVYRGTEATEYNGVPAVKATWDMVLKNTPEWPVTVTVALGSSGLYSIFNDLTSFGTSIV